MKAKILFVCLGNICRSPAAEGVMKAIVHREGRDEDFLIDSAGIGSWHVGQLPDWRMRRHGEKRGYHFDSLARQFTVEDFDRFDLILAMDDENFESIRIKSRHKSDMQKVRILANYLSNHPGVATIPDPYYGGDHAFKYALDLIEDACETLFRQLV
ncbi:MAG: low molecular weight phosphotyrosine protein phosphatase [Prevotella sp.]|nr:low molecular weight phosphotyrosine protein phosphatase [Prevotella sp.]